MCITKQTNIGDDLKRSGLKNTRCGSAILEILEQSNQPVTAEAVYHDLNEKNMPVSLSTVYRTLEALVDKNLITKLNLMGDS
ncbi:MAG: transcriptional repressor [Dehalobacterium sp.]